MPCTAKPAAGEVVPMPMEPLVVKFPLLVVVALPPIVRMVETYWVVLVALVVVAFQIERLVMVLVAWFTRSPPVSVERPVTESVPVAVIFAAERLPEKRPLPWTERSCEGEVVPMPTLPAPSMVRRSLVPRTDEEEILNLPPEAMSVPMVQLDIAAARPETVLDAVKVSIGEPAAVELAVYSVRRLDGVVVPMPTAAPEIVPVAVVVSA